jgi:hypothetical protein
MGSCTDARSAKRSFKLPTSSARPQSSNVVERRGGGDHAKQYAYRTDRSRSAAHYEPSLAAQRAEEPLRRPRECAVVR